MAIRKEVHFFDKEPLFRNAVDYSVYHSFFKDNPKGKLIGESTPIYMYWNDAPARIRDYNPEMKFIITLRNPIDRAFSHWNMERHKQKEAASFWDAISHEEKRCAKALPLQHRVYSYVDRGFYTRQLRRLWEIFPQSQTLVIKSEDLRNAVHPTLEQVAKFLKIGRFQEIEPETVHARPYISVMSEQERDFLRAKYDAEIKELEILLGWDCSAWLK